LRINKVYFTLFVYNLFSSISSTMNAWQLAKPNVSPPGYATSCLRPATSMSYYSLRPVTHMHYFSCRSLSPSTEYHRNSVMYVDKANKNWLPLQRPLKDRKTSFRLIIYSIILPTVPVCSRAWRHLELELFWSLLSTSRLCQPDDWPDDVDDMAALYNSQGTYRPT